MLTFSDIVKHWNNFFFRERPTYNLAYFRIIWGSLIFFNILFEIGNIEDFYGPQALVSWEVVSHYFPHFQLNLFKILKNTNANAIGVYLFTLVSLFLVTIGFFTRLALFGALIGLVSLHMRNVWILSSADVLIRCIFLILIWSPCYNVLSVDSFLAKKKGRALPKSAPQWTWRLIQIQISVVYLWTFWAKLKGQTWFEGSAVYYATRLDTMKNITLPWVLDNKMMIKFSTWLTLLVEMALGSLIWFKGLRTPVVMAGIILHLGIEVVMAIPFFEWMMIFLLMNFYTPEEYLLFFRRLILKLRSISFFVNASEKLKYRV